MKKRYRIYAIIVLVLVIGWIALAVTRQRLTAYRIETSLGIQHLRGFSGSVTGREVTVYVPLVPLLFNPFQRHPKAHLMRGEFPLAQITE